MDLDLTGKRALISGASKGIGLAIAKTLLAEGASVGICARGEAQLKTVADELSESGTVFWKSVDVGDSAAVTSFVDDAAESLGGIDIVIVNASAMTGKGREAWENSFNVDLMSLVGFIEAATPHLEKSSAASVVTISTTSAIEARPDHHRQQLWRAQSRRVAALLGAGTCPGSQGDSRQRGVARSGLLRRRTLGNHQGAAPATL